MTCADVRALVPYYADESVTLWHGDALDVLTAMPDASVNCCVTSPPYFGLRDYGDPGQWGLEASPAAYVERIRDLFRELARVLAPDGTAWLNIGDSYSGKANAGISFDRHRGRGHTAGAVAAQVNTTAFAPYKSLIGIPWRVAFALQDDGWIIRNAIVWAKPNANPDPAATGLTSGPCGSRTRCDPRGAHRADRRTPRPGRGSHGRPGRPRAATICVLTGILTDAIPATSGPSRSDGSQRRTSPPCRRRSRSGA